MPIKWKSSFKPEVVLERIDAARKVGADGGASFSGFDWVECVPALHSMLQFPPAASEIDVASLVWKALVKAPAPLRADSFLRTANDALSSLLATREEQYRLLTTASIRRSDVPATVSCLGAQIRFLDGPFPARFGAARDTLIREHFTGVPQAPASYTRVVVSVSAKSQEAAFAKATRALDLQRALLCLVGNTRMELGLGMPSHNPINVVRLGGHHTLHHTDGRSAREGFWFEPGYVEARVFGFSEPSIARKRRERALRGIRASRYGDELASALIRYVRALDESDANTAFLRLWTAVEVLTTPGKADFDKLIRRCAFLFQQGAFHRQMLEHLREYRNSTVHAGEYSDRARAMCFQLQLYFNALIWFHMGNATAFQSLDEANQFLDMPPDKAAISRQIKLGRRALKYVR